MPKHALVTGAGTGIGRAIARELAKAGYDVALHCNASRDGAESAAAEIRALGRRAEVYQADLSSTPTASTTPATCSRRSGRTWNGSTSS